MCKVWLRSCIQFPKAVCVVLDLQQIHLLLFLGGGKLVSLTEKDGWPHLETFRRIIILSNSLQTEYYVFNIKTNAYFSKEEMEFQFLSLFFSFWRRAYMQPLDYPRDRKQALSLPELPTFHLKAPISALFEII